MDYADTKQIIETTQILSDEDLQFVNSNIAEIQEHWAKKQLYRTETEMRVSVLNDTKFPTPASKYWQCVREQSGFYESLVAESFMYRRNQLKLERIERKLEKATEKGKDIRVRELQIDREELQFAQMNIRQHAKDRVRELRLWSKLMQEQVAADPTFDTENVDTHQLVSYTQRWHRQLMGLRGSNSSAAEINNLVGQYESGLRELLARGVSLPPELIRDANRVGIPGPSLVKYNVNFDLPNNAG